MRARWSVLVGGSIAVALALPSCASGGYNRVPSDILELERSGVLDVRAIETCNESSPNPGPLVTAADSSAGAIRSMYEDGETFLSSGVDALPEDPETYGAICIRDVSAVERSGAFDRSAVWVSSDDRHGGVIVIAIWDEDAIG